MSNIEKLKWQIHAETSITQATLWGVLGILIGGWFWVIAGVMIFGNIVTSVSATSRLGRDYLHPPKQQTKEDV